MVSLILTFGSRSDGVRGAWEQALIGTPIRNIKNRVEAGHVVRANDPCLVYAVRCLQKKEKIGSLAIGLAH